MQLAPSQTGAARPSNERVTTPDLERVFGRARLRVSTSRCVEVFREAAAPGERRRYSKRFLATASGDFRHWTAREARILAHLSANGVRCVPAIAAAVDGPNDALQTFDAGVTIAQWSSLVPVERSGHPFPHVFADAAHWWALAHHTLRALETVHLADVVHLHLTPDNICVPVLPANFDADVPNATIGLRFARLAIIDFAFALSAHEPLALPLPVDAPAAHAWQSPRLVQALAAARTGDLRAMQALDWRCDLFSIAALLRRYLPQGSAPADAGWTDARCARAVALLTAIQQAHDGDVGKVWPHEDLIGRCETEMQEPEVVTSLLEGFVLARAFEAPALAPPPVRVSPRVVEPTPTAPLQVRPPRVRRELKPLPLGVATAIGLALVVAGIGPYVRDQWQGNRMQQQADDATARSAPPASPSRDEEPSSALPERRNSQLPTDVQTMQRATRPEGRDTPQRPRAAMPQTQSREPLASAPAPAPQPQPADTPAPPRPVDADVVPGTLTDVAATMQSEVARVLATAARAVKPADDDNILQAARSMRSTTGGSGLPTASRTLARTLNAEARTAWERQDIDRAIGLQQQAFRANPNDPEVAGNLAFFYLKVRPARPAQARQLALYALAARGSTFPAGREEDWGTFAVASALEGRQADATRALLVMFTLSKNPERACRAALLAMAQYGPAMTAPARAMLSRVRNRGSAATAPSCR